MGTQEVLRAWVQDFRRAPWGGIPAATFDAALRGVAFNPKVVERDRNQTSSPRRSGIIWTRRSPKTGGAGDKAVVKHRDLLDRIDGGIRGREGSGSRASGVWKAPMAPFAATCRWLGSLATWHDGRRGRS